MLRAGGVRKGVLRVGGYYVPADGMMRKESGLLRAVLLHTCVLGVYECVHPFVRPAKKGYLHLCQCARLTTAGTRLLSVVPGSRSPRGRVAASPPCLVLYLHSAARCSSHRLILAWQALVPALAVSLGRGDQRIVLPGGFSLIAKRARDLHCGWGRETGLTS